MAEYFYATEGGELSFVESTDGQIVIDQGQNCIQSQASNVVYAPQLCFVQAKPSSSSSQPYILPRSPQQQQAPMIYNASPSQVPQQVIIMGGPAQVSNCPQVQNVVRENQVVSNQQNARTQLQRHPSNSRLAPGIIQRHPSNSKLVSNQIMSSENLVSVSQNQPSKLVSVHQNQPSKLVSIHQNQPSKFVSFSQNQPSKVTSTSMQQSQGLHGIQYISNPSQSTQKSFQTGSETTVVTGSGIAPLQNAVVSQSIATSSNLKSCLMCKKGKKIDGYCHKCKIKLGRMNPKISVTTSSSSVPSSQSFESASIVYKCPVCNTINSNMMECKYKCTSAPKKAVKVFSNQSTTKSKSFVQQISKGGQKYVIVSPHIQVSTSSANMASTSRNSLNNSLNATSRNTSQAVEPVSLPQNQQEVNSSLKDYGKINNENVQEEVKETVKIGNNYFVVQSKSQVQSKLQEKPTSEYSASTVNSLQMSTTAYKCAKCKNIIGKGASCDQCKNVSWKSTPTTAVKSFVNSTGSKSNAALNLEAERLAKKILAISPQKPTVVTSTVQKHMTSMSKKDSKIVSNTLPRPTLCHKCGSKANTVPCKDCQIKESVNPPGKQSISQPNSQSSTFIKNLSAKLKEIPAKKMKTKKRSKVTDYPVVLVLSSDDEDNSSKKSNKDAETNTSPSSSKQPRSIYQHPREPVIMSDNKLVNDQSIMNLISDNKTTLESKSTTYVSVQCRMIRIGTYKCVPSRKVVFSSSGINFHVQSCNNESPPKSIILPSGFILKILAHFGHSFPSFFLYGRPCVAACIRNALGLNDPSGAYFDPYSKEDCHKRILIISEKLNEEAKQIIKGIYRNHSININTIQVPLLEELKQKEAHEIFTLFHSSIKSQQENHSVSLFTYPPKPHKGGISISIDDYNCLEEEQFLNDVIIDFYLKWLIMEKLRPEVRTRTHVFSTFFYKRLTAKSKKKPQETLTPAERRHARVKSWTKNVDIFQKDFIIIPINEHSHWFLAIICFPGLNGPVYAKDNKPVVDNYKKKVKKKIVKQEPTIMDGDWSDRDEASGDEDEMMEEGDDDQPKDSSNDIKQPCIFIFDSLPGTSRAGVVETLRQYLTIEHLHRKHVKKTFNKTFMKGQTPVVPQQNNFSDCGIYTLQYAQSFFENPITDFNTPIASLEDWFPNEIVDKKREAIAILIKNLKEKLNPESKINLRKLHFQSGEKIKENDLGIVKSNSEPEKLSLQGNATIIRDTETSEVLLIVNNASQAMKTDNKNTENFITSTINRSASGLVSLANSGQQLTFSLSQPTSLSSAESSLSGTYNINKTSSATVNNLVKFSGANSGKFINISNVQPKFTSSNKTSVTVSFVTTSVTSVSSNMINLSSAKSSKQTKLTVSNSQPNITSNNEIPVSSSLNITPGSFVSTSSSLTPPSSGQQTNMVSSLNNTTTKSAMASSGQQTNMVSSLHNATTKSAMASSGQQTNMVSSLHNTTTKSAISIPGALNTTSTVSNNSLNLPPPYTGHQGNCGLSNSGQKSLLNQSPNKKHSYAPRPYINASSEAALEEALMEFENALSPVDNSINENSLSSILNDASSTSVTTDMINLPAEYSSGDTSLAPSSSYQTLLNDSQSISKTHHIYTPRTYFNPTNNQSSDKKSLEALLKQSDISESSIPDMLNLISTSSIASSMVNPTPINSGQQASISQLMSNKSSITDILNMNSTTSVTSNVVNPTPLNSGQQVSLTLSNSQLISNSKSSINNMSNLSTTTSSSLINLPSSNSAQQTILTQTNSQLSNSKNAIPDTLNLISTSSVSSSMINLPSSNSEQQTILAPTNFQNISSNMSLGENINNYTLNNNTVTSVCSSFENSEEQSNLALSDSLWRKTDMNKNENFISDIINMPESTFVSSSSVNLNPSDIGLQVNLSDSQPQNTFISTGESSIPDMLNAFSKTSKASNYSSLTHQSQISSGQQTNLSLPNSQLMSSDISNSNISDSNMLRNNATTPVVNSLLNLDPSNSVQQTNLTQSDSQLINPDINNVKSYIPNNMTSTAPVSINTMNLPGTNSTQEIGLSSNSQLTNADMRSSKASSLVKKTSRKSVASSMVSGQNLVVSNAKQQQQLANNKQQQQLANIKQQQQQLANNKQQQQPENNKQQQQQLANNKQQQQQLANNKQQQQQLANNKQQQPQLANNKQNKNTSRTYANHIQSTSNASVEFESAASFPKLIGQRTSSGRKIATPKRFLDAEEPVTKRQRRGRCKDNFDT